MITKEWIAQKIMNAAARVSLLARSNGRWFEVEGRGQSVGEPSYEDTVSHYQHYGFRSRPRKRAELITVPLMGAESQRVAVASEVAGLGPANQVEDDVEVYSAHGQRLIFASDRRVILTTYAGASLVLRDSAEGDGATLTASGKDAVYVGGVLTVNHTVASDHLVGTGNAPTATSAHANVTAVSITGRDTACEVSFAIVNAPTAGSLLTITWARQFASAPVSVVGVKAGSVIVNWSGSDTTLTIKSGTDPWPEGLYTITVLTVGV